MRWPMGSRSNFRTSFRLKPLSSRLDKILRAKEFEPSTLTLARLWSTAPSSAAIRQLPNIALFSAPLARLIGKPEFQTGRLGLTKVDVDDQLALGGMPGNVTFAGPVFCQHNAAGGELANVAIARLEFHLAGEPDHEFATRRVVPIHHSHSGGHPADVAAGCRKRLRQTQWRMAVEEGSGHQRDVDLFHVRFVLGVGVDTQIRH